MAKNKRKRSRSRSITRMRGSMKGEASAEAKLDSKSNESEVQEEEPSARNCCCFQDAMAKFQKEKSDENEEGSGEISLVFFELANSPYVSYRTKRGPKLIAQSDAGVPTAEEEITATITIKQDVSACGSHTGGIVWETAYLLLEYLRGEKEDLGDTLEVGAGCGLLGQALFASGISKRMVLTETSEVMPNLLRNMEANAKAISDAFKSTSECSTRRRKDRQRKKTIRKSEEETIPLHAVELDWIKCAASESQQVSKNDDNISTLRSHSFDTVVGTDVVFTPQLVIPLLETMRRMSKESGRAYLCLQERCPDSYALLLREAPQHGWEVVEDISTTVFKTPGCQWGAGLECKVLMMERRK